MTALDPALLVGIGGGLGAILRSLVIERLPTETFPLGTLAVNVTGTFVLGLATVAGLDQGFILLVGTGACGSFTTFSSFSFETVRLWETGERLRAGTNAVANLFGAVGALGLAWLVVAALG